MKNDIFSADESNDNDSAPAPRQRQNSDARSDARNDGREVPLEPRAPRAKNGGPGRAAAIVAVAVVIILIVAALFSFGLIGADEAVAVVNGEEISGATYEERVDRRLELLEDRLTQVGAVRGTSTEADIAAQLEQIAPRVREQTLVALIDQRLLLQAARQAGTEVSEEQVDAAIQEQVTQLGGEEKLEERLAVAGVSRSELRDILQTQLLIEEYAASQAPGGEIAASQNEIRALYNAYIARLQARAGTTTPTGLPSLEDLRSDLTQAVVVRERRAILGQLLSQERAQSEVTVLLEDITYPPTAPDGPAGAAEATPDSSGVDNSSATANDGAPAGETDGAAADETATSTGSEQ